MSNFLTSPNHWIALGVAIMLTSISQVLLRAGAKGQISTKTTSFLNSKILLGYLLFFVVVLLMIYSMQKISLRTASALISITYVLVPLMAHKFVGDPINTRIILGSLTIVVGIVVFFI